MNTLMAFFVALGIMSVSDTDERLTAGIEASPAAVEQTDQRLYERRTRIELTNAWLRELRQVTRHGYEPVGPIQVAAAD